MDQQKAATLLANFDRFWEREMAPLSAEVEERAAMQQLHTSVAMQSIMFGDLEMSEEEAQAAGVVLGLIYMSAITDAYRCADEGRQEHPDFRDEMEHLVTHVASAIQQYIKSVVMLEAVQKVRN